VLPELALLCQSRGSLVAAPVTALAYLAFVPNRARSLAYGAVAVLPTLVAHGPLLDVYPAIKDGAGIAHAVTQARNVVLITAAAGLAFGVVVAVVDRRTDAQGLRRAGARAIVGAAAVGAAALVVVLAVTLRHPEERLQHAWHDFKATKPTTASSYLANGLGGNRYDVWRVAFNEFKHKPLLGVGVDNFEADYLVERRSQEEPLYPHSVELRLLSQTGVVGTLLFVGFLGALVVTLRRLYQLPRSKQAVAGTALAMAVYWFVHGSIDWFWEIPALGGAAFWCLGLAASLTVGPSAGVRTPRQRRHLLTAGLATTAAGVAVAFALPWLAAEETLRAATSWREDPQGAYARLDTASRLNPLSDEPKVVEGAIASRLHDRARMRSAFKEALQRDPRDWYAHLELAVVASLEGRRTVALRELADARRLDPLEPVLVDVQRDVLAGKRVSPAKIDRIFLARIRL
jgi:hypothetical protein